MIEVSGKFLIDWILDDLTNAGVTTVVINLHYKADMLTTHLADRPAPRVIFSDETKQLLDTGGGVANALPLIKDEVIVVINSDALWRGGLTGALATLAQSWAPDAMDALLLLAPTDRARGFDRAGDFFLANGDTPERRGDRPNAPFAYAGTQFVHRRLFDDCPDGPFSFNLLWDRALGLGRLRAIAHNDDWFHVGTPDAVSPISAALKSGSANP